MNVATQRSAALFARVIAANPAREHESPERYVRRARRLIDRATRRPRVARRRAARTARKHNRKR